MNVRIWFEHVLCVHSSRYMTADGCLHDVNSKMFEANFAYKKRHICLGDSKATGAGRNVIRVIFELRGGLKVGDDQQATSLGSPGARSLIWLQQGFVRPVGLAIPESCVPWIYDWPAFLSLFAWRLWRGLVRVPVWLFVNKSSRTVGDGSAGARTFPCSFHILGAFSCLFNIPSTFPCSFHCPSTFPCSFHIWSTFPRSFHCQSTFPCSFHILLDCGRVECEMTIEMYRACYDLLLDTINYKEIYTVYLWYDI